MSAHVSSRTRGQTVFHIRLGGCGGCGDIVDAMLRDRYKGRPSVFECSSPRHASLFIVSGMWSEGAEGPVREVIAQAPEGTRILVAGDCALGRGLLAGSLEGMIAVAERIDVDAKVAGCPFTLAALGEGVRDVTR
ncbi:MAG: NADH-quinone oxidoreductase subunit B family protein [Candidatus Geothermincolia bacterium]